MTPSSGRRASSSRVRSIPLPSGSWMSTIATSGSAWSTRSTPAATLPAAPTTSSPPCCNSATRPSRRASWSSTITSLVMNAEPYSAHPPDAVAVTRAVTPRTRPAPNLRKVRVLSCNERPTASTGAVSSFAYGEGHREADPPALTHLVPHGRAPAGHRAGDPARRRGLQRHERGRLRPPLLRRPRRAGVAGHPAHGREAGRRRGRAGELLAVPGELPPPRDRLHRRGAGQPAVRADAARRRVRLRRAAAPGAAADLLGPAQPAARARPGIGRPRRHRLGRRPRPLAAPGQDRDRDLPQQDDHLRLLHDGARRGRRPQGRPVPPALPGRPVLPPGPLARARRHPGLPAVAHPRQGRLRDEGRARLQAPVGL